MPKIEYGICIFLWNNTPTLFIIFQAGDSNAYAFEVEFEEVEQLYGLFDHSYKLVLGETADHSSDPFRMKNVDASGFVPYPADSTMALYGAVATVYGHS